MSSQRTLLGMVIGLATACTASAETGTLRWRGGATPLGLQWSGADWRGPCGSATVGCEGETSTLRLYTSAKAPRSLSLQVSRAEEAAGLQPPRVPGPTISFVGKAGLVQDLGLGMYGRVGTASRAGLVGSEGGLTYGVGLSWDFSRRGSAIVGWDSYDFRTAGGEARDVRATSLGLQWRY